MTRNRPIARRLASFALAIFGTAAVAADFPTRPIRLIVNSSAGGLLDAHVRAVALEMGRNLGQQVVVENNPGGGGLLGIRQVKNAAPDGYTLLAAANTLAQATVLRAEPGYELKDFAPIGVFSQAPFLFVGAVSQPERTLAEVVARAKAQPDSMTYGSAGIGTSTHLAGALFMNLAGVKMLHVPYRGNAAAMPDVLAGRVNVIFDGGNTSGPFLREGRVRAYGISSAQRNASFPDIPTIAEQGFPNYSFTVYFGLTAPAGTPPDVVQRLAQSLRAAVGTESVKERFRRDGAEALPISPEEFGAFLRDDAQRTGRLAVQLNLPKE